MLTAFILDLQKIHDNDGLTVKHGKIHSYLGINFEYSTDGEFKVSMIKYADQILDNFPNMITSTHRSPAVGHLFKIREESKRKLLPEEQVRHFHHLVAQMLFLYVRARLDLQTVVSFLTKQVKNPDEDDWGNLKRGLKYLKGTCHITLVLKVDSLSTIIRWVAASHSVH